METLVEFSDKERLFHLYQSRKDVERRENDYLETIKEQTLRAEAEKALRIGTEQKLDVTEQNLDAAEQNLDVAEQNLDAQTLRADAQTLRADALRAMVIKLGGDPDSL